MEKDRPAIVIVKCERGVPIYGVPVISEPFLATAAVAGLGLVLVVRQVAGLGATPEVDNAYAWGISKTFNTMVLTALGCGSFAIGISAWIFGRRELHSVMRVALLVSFLVYAAGLIVIAVDVGQPWSFWNLLLPSRWNTLSPMWGVALCVPLYAFFPLFLENTPPMLERIYYLHPVLQPTIRRLVPAIRATYPWVVALAFLLPMLHQSSLGALLVLAGSRVHPLWQTPLLPLLYLWAAAFIGTASVILALLLSFLAWKRPLDCHVLRSLSLLASNLALVWLVVRAADIIVRGEAGAALALNSYALVFWSETALITHGAVALRPHTYDPYHVFVAALTLVSGGMVYRYAPPALAFAATPLGWYTPSVVEVLVGLGVIAWCCLGFLIAVKRLPILPAPTVQWDNLFDYGRHLAPWIRMSRSTNA